MDILFLTSNIYAFSALFERKKRSKQLSNVPLYPGFSSHNELSSQPKMGIHAAARIPGALTETDEIKEHNKTKTILFSISPHFMVADPIY